MSRDRYAKALALYRDTSRQAFTSVLAALPSIDARIVSVIERMAHCGGGTCGEVEAATLIKHETVSAQIRHMVEAGLLVDSKATRKNANGRACIVWTLAPRYCGPFPGQPGYLASLPVVASIEKHRGPLTQAAAPTTTDGRLF